MDVEEARDSRHYQYFLLPLLEYSRGKTIDESQSQRGTATQTLLLMLIAVLCVVWWATLPECAQVQRILGDPNYVSTPTNENCTAPKVTENVWKR